MRDFATFCALLNGRLHWLAMTNHVLAVANHKGGVGKTAVAHALGVALAAVGRRVLLVDADPQASLTGAVGLGDVAGRSLADVLTGGAGLADVIADLGGGLAIAPADIALSRAELALVARLGRENALKRALATVNGRFDLILIDCPPSLSLLTVNALTAAGGGLVPTIPQAVDLRGLALFLDTLEELRTELNPGLALLGVLVTFYDGRLLHHRDAVEVMTRGGLPVLPVTVGRSVRVAEAAAAGETILTYEPTNPRAAEFLTLAEIVNAWLNEQR